MNSALEFHFPDFGISATSMNGTKTLPPVTFSKGVLPSLTLSVQAKLLTEIHIKLPHYISFQAPPCPTIVA